MRPHIVAYDCVSLLSIYINIRSPRHTTALCALDYSNAAAAGGGGIYIRMQFIKSSINTGSVYYTRIVRSLTHSARPLSHSQRISICICAICSSVTFGWQCAAPTECYYISAPNETRTKKAVYVHVEFWAWIRFGASWIRKLNEIRIHSCSFLPDSYLIIIIQKNFGRRV